MDQLAAFISIFHYGFSSQNLTDIPTNLLLGIFSSADV
jgi:hypothetical protein